MDHYQPLCLAGLESHRRFQNINFGPQLVQNRIWIKYFLKCFVFFTTNQYSGAIGGFCIESAESIKWSRHSALINSALKEEYNHMRFYFAVFQSLWAESVPQNCFLYHPASQNWSGELKSCQSIFLGVRIWVKTTISLKIFAKTSRRTVFGAQWELEAHLPPASRYR